MTIAKPLEQKGIEKGGQEGKCLKTPEDLNQFDCMLQNISAEAALFVELPQHLGQEKYQPKSGVNSRNGYSPKTVVTTEGSL